MRRQEVNKFIQTSNADKLILVLRTKRKILRRRSALRKGVAEEE